MTGCAFGLMISRLILIDVCSFPSSGIYISQVMSRPKVSPSPVIKHRIPTHLPSCFFLVFLLFFHLPAPSLHQSSINMLTCTKSAAAVAAIAGLAMATPVKIDKRKTFSVSEVAVPKKAVHPAHHLAKAYAKYHKAVPANIQKAADGETGSVAANPTSGDEEYLVQVTVGQDTLNLDFDTGSSDLWVFSDLLDSSTTSGHGVYETGHGSLEDGESWTISYGDGSGASGSVYADSVVVGGVTATSQAVEAATSISSSFASGQGDGLLGLAFSSINTVTPDRATTFFDTVSSQLAADLFTARLRKGTPGTYDFGYIDSSKYSGDIYYTDVDNSQGFWGFTPDSYSVGSSQGSASIGASIADTGTTLLLLPDDVVRDQSYLTWSDYASNCLLGLGLLQPG